MSFWSHSQKTYLRSFDRPDNSKQQQVIKLKIWTKPHQFSSSHRGSKTQVFLVGRISCSVGRSSGRGQSICIRRENIRFLFQKCIFPLEVFTAFLIAFLLTDRTTTKCFAVIWTGIWYIQSFSSSTTMTPRGGWFFIFGSSYRLIQIDCGVQNGRRHFGQVWTSWR